MKFKIDENLPSELALDLRAAGHDAETVPEEALAGFLDPPILEKARSEGRILVTMDKGIADVRVYPPGRFAGIVLLRARTSGGGAVLSFARRHLPAVLQHDLARRLCVVSERGIRIR